MWIGRKEFESLVSRVTALEKREEVRLPVFYVNTGKTTHTGHWDYPETKPVPIKEAVELVMNHVGVELKYDAGTPPVIGIAKKKRATAA